MNDGRLDLAFYSFSPENRCDVKDSADEDDNHGDE